MDDPSGGYEKIAAFEIMLLEENVEHPVDCQNN